MKSKTPIIFLSSRLDMPGGIERAIVNATNLFLEEGHSVTLIIFDKTTASFYPINQNATILNHHLHFGISEVGNPISRKIQLWQDIKTLKKLIESAGPGLIISTEYVFTIAAYFAVGRTRTVFGWEHHHFNWLEKNRFWQFLFRFVYPKIKIICLNKIEAEYYKKIKCQVYVIPNFINTPCLEYSAAKTKRLLTVGWLINRKGIDLIPAVAKRIFEEYPDWQWRIIGEGPLEEIFRNLPTNIGRHIEIVKPYASDLTSQYKNAELYVMLSRFECFPMVLLEAMSYGVPVVSFNCLSGPGDIIKQNEDGILVEPENVQKMTDSIIHLIKNENKRIKMGQTAQSNIQRFQKNKVYPLWESAFQYNS